VLYWAGGGGLLERMGPEKIETFSGPEITTSKTHYQCTGTYFYMAHGLNDFDAGKSINRAIGRDFSRWFHQPQ
jgi:hypothetical protein